MIAFGAIAAFTVSATALWTASFFGNRGFIAAAQAHAAAAKSELEKLGAAPAGQEAQLLHALNALRDLPGGFRDRQGGASVTSGYGLSQGDKIGTQAVRAYRNALRDALLPRLAASKDDYSKWGLTDAERADLEGHVRAMREEAIMGGARPNSVPAKSP
jgi:type VI secretion system protein ImpL